MKLTITNQNHYIKQNTADQESFQEYIERAHRRYEDYLKSHPNYSIPFEDEELIWTIQEWYGMVGEFSEEELEYLEKTWDLTQYDLEFLFAEE